MTCALLWDLKLSCNRFNAIRSLKIHQFSIRTPSESSHQKNLEKSWNEKIWTHYWSFEKKLSKSAIETKQEKLKKPIKKIEFPQKLTISNQKDWRSGLLKSVRNFRNANMIWKEGGKGHVILFWKPTEISCSWLSIITQDGAY